MNGSDIDRVEEVFGAKIDPLIKAVETQGLKIEAHSESIAIMKTKFESVEKDVEIIFEKKLPTLSNRLWGVVIGVPVLIAAVVTIVAYVLGRGG